MSVTLEPSAAAEKNQKEEEEKVFTHVDTTPGDTKKDEVPDAPLEHEVLGELPKNERWDPTEFDHAFLDLYMHEPFLGAVSLKVTKVADFRQPTAYIAVRRNGKSYELVMGYNPLLFRQLNKERILGVIKHELYHMIFQHIFTRKIGDKSYSQLWNWATDLSINSIIGENNLPDFCLIPGKRPINSKTKEPQNDPYADYIATATPLQCSDHYFEELRKIQEQQGQSGDGAIEVGFGTMDDHGGWQDLPPEVQEEIRDRIHNIMDQAARKADRDNSWGTVPMDIQEIIRKMISKQIDWRSIVRNFMGRCRTMERISSIRRVNKKIPYKLPGVKRPLRATFACFMDQSGSMSDSDIALLFGELDGLAQETTIDIYHFDTEIDLSSHTTWKKGSSYPTVLRTKCGGTDFNSVANFCNRTENRGKWTGIIILTDGYAPVMGQILGAKVLWVVTEDGTMEAVRPGDLACKMSVDKQFKSY